MSNTLFINQPQVVEGHSQTMTYTIPSGATGPYNVRVQALEVPLSAMSFLVKDNGSTIYTSDTLGQTQAGNKFKHSFLGTATHIITVELSSSQANDLLMNTVKTIVSIGQGF